MSAKKWGRIRNAHDAYWFLHEHPKFAVCEFTRITAKEAKEKSTSWVAFKEKGQWWRKWRLKRHALDENLEIDYQLVDKTRRVNDDSSKNVNVECWLEFGAPFKNTGPICGYWDNDGPYYLMNSHDIRLDCGAPTFDGALVILANKVRRFYGDFTMPAWVRPRQKSSMRDSQRNTRVRGR